MASDRPKPPPLPSELGSQAIQEFSTAPTGSAAEAALCFAGIVEGELRSRSAGQSTGEGALRESNGHRWFADGRDLAALEWEGSRYSIWFREDPVHADSIPVDLHDALLTPLQEVAAVSTPAGLESTLRWRHAEGEKVTE